MVRGEEDLASFILSWYRGKVVEVGVGFDAGVLSRLGPHAVGTDIEARTVAEVSVLKDDIFSPDITIYEGSCLIYSIRPPLEIQIAIGRIAKRLDADVIIRPLGDEVADLQGFSRRLINWGEARFYLYSPGELHRGCPVRATPVRPTSAPAEPSSAPRRR